MLGHWFALLSSRLFNKYFSYLKSLSFSDTTCQLTICDVIMFCHDVDRNITLDNKAYSPLVDCIREDFEGRGLKCISVSYPFSVLTGERGYGSPISLNRSYLTDLLKKKLLPTIIKKVLPNSSNVYHRILNITGAKLIISIGSAEDLCEEARLKGCLHVELLHGMGYRFLPWGWADRSLRHLPQGILSLDQLSASSFSSALNFVIPVHTIPHPFLKKLVDGKKFSLPKEWQLSQIDRSLYKKEILVSLGWGYAGDHGAHKQFSDILSNGLFYDELAEVVAESRDIYWRFRFHPVQLRQKKYRHLVAYMEEFVCQQPNTEWRESSSLPFSSVIRHCSGNISMSSMSCYDASALGCTSLMLCPNILPGGIHEDWFEDLVQEGYVVKAIATKELISSWAKGVKKLQPRLSNLEDDAAWEDAVKWLMSASGLESRVNSRYG